MFFARTLSWLGFFPRFTSVTCFRTFLHLCSCSTFSPARHLAESTLFPQSRRCDWPHFVIILEVFILWRTFASGELTHLLWILQESWIQHGTVKENILFGMPFDVEKYSAVIDACALVEVWKKVRSWLRCTEPHQWRLMGLSDYWLRCSERYLPRN